MDQLMAANAQSDPELPRDPAAYRPTNHFAERFHDRYDEYNRHIDGEVVRACIEDGEARDRAGDRVYLRKTIGGVTFRLVVSPGMGTVVTGHPIGVNTEAARDSGRWSAQQIEEIQEFLAAGPPDHDR